MIYCAGKKTEHFDPLTHDIIRQNFEKNSREINL